MPLFLYLLLLYFLYWLLRYVIADSIFLKSIRGKSILVVGSTTGFGHDIVLKCVRNGAIVFAGCNSPSGIELLKRECDEKSGKVYPFKLDVTSQESVDDAYEFVVNHLPDDGKDGLYAIVNNAGIIVCGADDWLSPEDYDRVWNVNALGLIRITQKFKQLIKKAKGRIVNCSSVCGRLALYYYGPYTVSKFALEAYSDTIRRELEPFGVKVSIVEPSYFKTPITNPSHIPNSMRDSFLNASKEVHDEYGAEFVETVATKQEKLLKSSWNSPHVEWVVDCYYHAMVSPLPKKRYVVGREANYLFVPIARLTADLQDIIFQIFARSTGILLPKALQEEALKEKEN